MKFWKRKVYQNYGKLHLIKYVYKAIIFRAEKNQIPQRRKNFSLFHLIIAKNVPFFIRRLWDKTDFVKDLDNCFFIAVQNNKYTREKKFKVFSGYLKKFWSRVVI